MGHMTKHEKQKALKMAGGMADDFDAEKAKDFSRRHTDKSWFKDFKLLYDMITHPTFKLQSSSRILIAGALAYVIMPIDIIPDFIPVFGWIDDAFVLAVTINRLSSEINRFKNQN